MNLSPAFERQDDWCATAYFYLDKPTDNLPVIEPYKARIAGLQPKKWPDCRLLVRQLAVGPVRSVMAGLKRSVSECAGCSDKRTRFGLVKQIGSRLAFRKW